MDRKRRTKRGNGDMTVRQKAYLFIQRGIAAGDLKAGTPISEIDLARKLGISRTPIREAVGQLIAEGLLEHSPTGGALVTQLNREDIFELYELREALEVFAVRKLVRLGLRPEDSSRLQALVDDLGALKQVLESSGEQSLNAEQMNRFLASDFAFHALLVTLARNFRMQKVISGTRLLLRVFACYRRGHDLARLEEVYQEHQNLLNALINRDQELTVQLISKHVETSQRDSLDDFDSGKKEEWIRSSIPSFLGIPESIS